MSACYTKEFLKSLDYIKYGLDFFGKNTEILEIIYSLKNHLKEFYPINKVPDEIINQLEILEKSFQSSTKILHETVDVIIQSIKKDRGVDNV